MDNFVIKAHRPWFRRIIYPVLFVALAVLIAGSADFFDVHRKPDGNWGFSLPWNVGMDLSRDQLLGENTELREKVLILEQNTRLDKQAAALLQEKLIVSQEEIFQLSKDLEFYQGIINASGEENSPGVHNIRIKPLTHAHGYRLELIFLYISNSDKLVEGVIDVVLEGILDNVVKRLSLNEISLDENQIYTIRFRNFQRYENNFILPVNFKPQRVFVTLSINDRKEPGFEKAFDWPVTDGRETADVG